MHDDKKFDKEKIVYLYRNLINFILYIYIYTFSRGEVVYLRIDVHMRVYMVGPGRFAGNTRLINDGLYTLLAGMLIKRIV